jgi:hypothetical protein
MIQSVDRLPFETITHGSPPLPSLSCKTGEGIDPESAE